MRNLKGEPCFKLAISKASRSWCKIRLHLKRAGTPCPDYGLAESIIFTFSDLVEKEQKFSVEHTGSFSSLSLVLSQESGPDKEFFSNEINSTFSLQPLNKGVTEVQSIPKQRSSYSLSMTLSFWSGIWMVVRGPHSSFTVQNAGLAHRNRNI